MIRQQNCDEDGSRRRVIIFGSVRECEVHEERIMNIQG